MFGIDRTKTGDKIENFQDESTLLRQGRKLKATFRPATYWDTCQSTSFKGVPTSQIPFLLTRESYRHSSWWLAFLSWTSHLELGLWLAESRRQNSHFATKLSAVASRKGKTPLDEIQGVKIHACCSGKERKEREVGGIIFHVLIGCHILTKQTSIKTPSQG